jgi:hypothetical protein
VYWLIYLTIVAVVPGPGYLGVCALQSSKYVRTISLVEHSDLGLCWILMRVLLLLDYRDVAGVAHLSRRDPAPVLYRSGSAAGEDGATQSRDREAGPPSGSF